MMKHVKTTPQDREDRNAPITAAENPASSAKRGCFKKKHSIRRGAPRWRATSRTHRTTKRLALDIKDEQMTPL